MNRFHKSTITSSLIVFQGTNVVPINKVCDEGILLALDRWLQRKKQSNLQPANFHFQDTRGFSISFNGESDNYWPDSESNLIEETLVRELLYEDGVCCIDQVEPKLYVVNYKVETLIDREFLLVCPYPTESGDIGGLLVVCVNRRLKSGTYEV